MHHFSFCEEDLAMDFPSDDAICARGGWYPDFTTRPSAPALWQTTAFDLEGLEQLEAITTGREKGYIYTRDGNPNQEAFAHDVAELERAEAGVVCASGMGAMTAAVLAHARPGDHILAARVLYGKTIQLLQQLQSQFGIDVAFVDATDLNAIRNAVTSRTTLAIIESISNPLLEVADLDAVSQALGNVPLLVDNTFATPCLLRPLEHGAKFVFHSASKYLNGHGDVMLGVVVGERLAVRKMRGLTSLFGLNSNPFECWLASRGMRTLPVRVRQASETAGRVAEWLKVQPGISRVFYPGLSDHSTHTLAARVLKDGFGGMLAFDLEGGRPAVAQLFRTLHRDIPFSPTLADTRSTFSYPWETSHKFISVAERRACGIGDGLVRLSVGLEPFHDLCRDLSTGLAATRM